MESEAHHNRRSLVVGINHPAASHIWGPVSGSATLSRHFLNDGFWYVVVAVGEKAGFDVAYGGTVLVAMIL